MTYLNPEHGEKGVHIIPAGTLIPGTQLKLSRELPLSYFMWHGAGAGAYVSTKIAGQDVNARGAVFGDSEFYDFEDAGNLILGSIAGKMETILNVPEDERNNIQRATLAELEGLLQAA